MLIVEDDADVLLALRHVLEAEGYEVATAANGRDALVALREGRALPGLILLDLWMPVMDGFEFRARQREDAALRDIPVLVISAAGPLLERVSELEAAGVLKKPLDMATLLGTIASYMRR